MTITRHEERRRGRLHVRAALAIAAAGMVGGALAGCGSSNSTAAPPSAGSPQASLSITSIDFGANDCGGQAPTEKSLTITNGGTNTLTWNASVDDNSFFDIDGPRSGSVSAGSTANVQIKAASIPAATKAGAVLTATLLVTTNDPTAPKTLVPIKATAQGGTLVLKPGSADFGQVPLGTQAPDIPLTLTNVGNKDVTVSFSSPKDADFSIAPSSGAVPAGGTLSGLVARFKPSSAGKAAGPSDLTVTGAICGVNGPTSAIVVGEGITGVVGVSPSTLDFGSVVCGSTAPFQIATVINSGKESFTWTAALGNGASSAYTITPSAGTATPNSATQIFVTPKPVPSMSAVTPNLYGDLLTITTNVPKDAPHAVTLEETAQGAILQYSASAFAFTNAPIFANSAKQTLTITNSGNVDAPIAITFGVSPPDFVATPASGTAAANGGQLGVDVNAYPQHLTNFADTVNVATTAPLCQPLPAKPTLGGNSIATTTQVSLGNTPPNWNSQAVRTNRDANGCALLPGGHVGCWGHNGWGQLGVDGVKSSQGAQVVQGLSGATHVATEGDFSCALLQAGTVSCWGRNDMGQLGDGGGAGSSSKPITVQAVSNATAVAVGHHTACALISGGTVKCWGTNWRGQLGSGVTGTMKAANSPALVKGLSNATALAGGGFGFCALLSDKTVACWGGNESGYLGTGTTNNCIPNNSWENCFNTPQAVSGLTNVVAIAVGRTGGWGGPSCALRGDGTVWCWGRNRHGELGNNSLIDSTTPGQVQGITNATSLVAAEGTACATTGSGFKCWGKNRFGGLGNGTSGADALVPGAGPALSNVSSYAGGGNTLCAVLTSGSVQCWGKTVYGATPTPKTLPFF